MNVQKNTLCNPKGTTVAQSNTWSLLEGRKSTLAGGPQAGEGLIDQIAHLVVFELVC